ncbi:MAG: two-component system, chemotaxis family, CheB/CheR fusion protein [Methyloprofundus sp.]|nr:MAG: two-component system, chemotaxis family, CheB/CheR fusion protein [Methyloprofundus sp.]
MSQPINILYLEDDIPLANLIKRNLERKGYHVSIVADGLECVATVKHNPIDLLIADYNTPSLNGLGVLQSLQLANKMPLSIMVSGSNDVQVVIAAMKLGCSDYVIKEIDNYFDLLLVSIEKVLEKKRLIHDKELAETELIKSNQGLQRAQKLAKVGSWEYYPGELTANWSEQEYLNFDCPSDQAPSYEKYTRYIHPEDIANVEQKNALCLKKQCPVDFNFRLLLNDGSIRYLHCHTEVDTDQQHNIKRIFGISKDITAEVIAASKLQQAATVFNNTAEAIFITDANNVIISINPAYTQTTGYAEHEVLGKNPNIMSSGHHDKAFFAKLWHELLHNGQWQGEIWNRHKNGNTFPVWQSITAIKDITGKIVQFVSIFNDISVRKADEELIRYQANYDSLTGLPNRNLFLDRISIALKRAQRENKQLALLMIDLDRFKWINDTLGHKAGDVMLQETARRLQSSVRDSDTVARLGGDEFIIIVSELQHPSDTEMIANKIFAAFKAPLQLENHEVFISGSIGITIFPDDGNTVETLQMNADSAMYSAKEDGRNRFHYFTPQLQAKAERHLQLVSLLQLAIERNEFDVYYQPVIDCKHHKVISAEALIRWQQPQLGFISPAEFIPLAEESGLIRAIGDWVVHRVAEDMQRWQKMGLPAMHISINKSPHQFSNESCDEDWLSIFKQHNIDVSRITVEITESVFMEKGRDYVKSLADMQKQGMKISLDDFGTGYSSLSYLKRFPVDILKIDRSFISDVSENASDAMLVEMILGLADKMHIAVIAEGVETAEQLAFLQKHQCQYIQGYFYSKPLPVHEFEDFFSKPLS